MKPPKAGWFAVQSMYWKTVVGAFLYEKNLSNRLLAMVNAMSMAGQYYHRSPLSVHEIPEHYTYLSFLTERLIDTLHERFDQIDHFFREQDIEINKVTMQDFIVATLPVAEANAGSKIAPNGQTIFFYNLSIVPIIYALSRFFAENTQVEPAGTELACEYDLEVFHKSIENFTETPFRNLHDAIRGIIYSDMRKLTSIAGPPKMPHLRLYQGYCDSMATYVVAHEIGHKSLGHLNDDLERKAPNLYRHDDLTDFQMDELDADIFAYIFNVIIQEQNAINGGYVPSVELTKASALKAFQAQDIVLRAYWMMEAICQKLCGRDGKTSTLKDHPPYSIRLETLRQLAETVIPDHSQLIQHIVDMHQKIFQKVGKLVFLYGQEFERDLEVSEYLREAFGLVND